MSNSWVGTNGLYSLASNLHKEQKQVNLLANIYMYNRKSIEDSGEYPLSSFCLDRNSHDMMLNYLEIICSFAGVSLPWLCPQSSLCLYLEPEQASR